jgi:hypothetical protein
VQGAKQSAALVKSLGGGVVPIDQIQQPQRCLRRLAHKPAPVATLLDSVIQAGQGPLERRVFSEEIPNLYAKLLTRINHKICSKRVIKHVIS